MASSRSSERGGDVPVAILIRLPVATKTRAHSPTPEALKPIRVMRSRHSREGTEPTVTTPPPESRVRGTPMLASRRQFVAAGLLAPFIASCATRPGRATDESLPALAARLRVNATYVTLEKGRPNAPVVLSGNPEVPRVHSDSIFQAASLTKQVIAYAVLRYVLAGRLDLQAPASRYLPDGYLHRRNPFGGPDDRSTDLVAPETLARIPVATLLNHSSGLPNWTRGRLAPGFEPGKRWQYSGEGYLLLQAILGALTGTDIEALLGRDVFAPLGMHDSRLRLTDDIRPRVVIGTSRSGRPRHFEFHEPNAAASLYSTAPDYARLLAAWLAQPELLEKATANPIPTDPELGLSWGYGWGIESTSVGPCLWQWGNNPGYRAFTMVSTSSRNGFVLLTNSERGMALASPLARSVVSTDHPVFRFRSLS